MIEILYRDPSMVVCVKPAGVISESPGMPEWIARELGLDPADVQPVHRLDKETAGVMVYALQKEQTRRLTEAFAAHTAEKHYLAITGPVPEDFPQTGIWKDLLYFDRQRVKSFVVKRPRKGVKEAELSYRILGRTQTRTLFEMQLRTGRTHQIRVQSASRGLPLLGDGRYGGEKHAGLALFACRLTVPDANGTKKTFSALPPKEDPWDLFPVIFSDHADLSDT